VPRQRQTAPKKEGEGRVRPLAGGRCRHCSVGHPGCSKQQVFAATGRKKGNVACKSEVRGQD